jgi:hypothetical protein
MNEKVYTGVLLTDDWLCREKKWTISKLLRLFLKEKLGNTVCFCTALPGENGFFGRFDLKNKNALDAVRLCGKNQIRFLINCSFLMPEAVNLLQTQYGELFIASQALNETSTCMGSNWERQKPHLAALHAKHPDGFEPQFSPTPEPTRCENFQQAHDAYLRWITTMVESEKGRGIKTVCNIDARPYFHLSGKAGVDLLGTEMMVMPVDPILSALRGTIKAYGKKEFTAFPAVGWYGGSEFDPDKPGRLKLALYSAYLHGAKYIFSESDHFCPTIRFPRIFNDPLSVKTRKVLKDFYRFTQKDNRPVGFPKTNVAFVQGYLDSWCGSSYSDHGGYGILWGQEDFTAGAAEKSWEFLDVVFPNYSRFNRQSEGWFGGTPYGPVDLIPIDAPPKFLHQYKLLVFLGWNTLTEENYQKLLAYVRSGGCLFMSLLHASTDTKYLPTEQRTLYRKGDLSELFGVKIKSLVLDDARKETGCGHCRNPLQGIFVTGQTKYNLKKGRCYPFTYDTREIQAQIAGAEMIARANNGQPILTRKAFPGGGEAFLLVAPDYPIVFKNLVKDFLAGLVEHHQTAVQMVDSRDINFAVYEGEKKDTIYLLNTNLKSPVRCSLEYKDKKTNLSFKPGEFKVVHESGTRYNQLCQPSREDRF